MLYKIAIFVFTAALFFNSAAFAKAVDADLRSMFQNNQAIIYAINLRTFNANDKNGNGIIEFSLGETSGTFINAIDRLDELKKLNINTLHVLPITPVGKIKALGTAGSLYAISDFKTFNPQLQDKNSSGSVKTQAKKFIDECHKRGIKVMIDLPSCGAYDLYLQNPELFILNKDGTADTPMDWYDVRTFNVPNDETLLSSEIFLLHKAFIDNLLEIGADGLRADVATIKPYIFWKELIAYTRSKNKNFLFLAEASGLWNGPISKNAYFTHYANLLDAGFDGYYGDFPDFAKWKTADKLNSSVLNYISVLNTYNEKKSVIGSFETHDTLSPLLEGGENYSKIIIWLNATLPLNPYYVDGFLQGDNYKYPYSNKKAEVTYTDYDRYYVHNGQLDIFNFSRKPKGESRTFINEHKSAMSIRNKYHEIIESGEYVPVKTDNNKVFAYKRQLKNKSLFVFANRNTKGREKLTAALGQFGKKSKISFIKGKKEIKNSTLFANLEPGEVVIFIVE